jgi:hypothetical protein
VRRVPLAALAATVALAGCPLPQPLPDYPAGTITPPRILTATTTRPSESIIPVPANCTGTPPVYDLGARIFYQETFTVEARWFVDYRKDLPSRYAIQNTLREVPADPDPLILEREVPAFTFHPYGYPPPDEMGPAFADWNDPGIVHVVELVVSNDFDPSDTVPEPNRTPAVTNGAARFEIQTYRWVFLTVAESPPGCSLGEPGCVRCPP